MSSLSRILAQPFKQEVMEKTQPQDKSSKLPQIIPPSSFGVVPAVSREYSYTQVHRTLNSITISQIFYDVYASHTQLPTYIQRVIREYVPEETASILEGPFLRTIPDFVHLTDLAVLKTYLGANCKGPKHISKALEIAQSTYEAGPRTIKSAKSGLAFPINPEILAYTMSIAKNEKVLEIAGASGENAILLAFSDAQKVYFNEIAKGELDAFYALRNQLPTNVKNKLEPIPGDCFNIMQKRPELKGQMGLIICRNLIHFFNDQQQEEFFKMLNTLLKPGGRVVLMVNSTYTFPKQRQFFNENADSTCFTQTLCLVDDLDTRPMPNPIMQELAVCSPDKMLHNAINLVLYQRNAGSGFKWQVDKEMFSTLNPDLKKSIRQALETFKESIKKIKHGGVRVLISTTRAYTKENLLSLSATYGLDTESVFVVGRDGHLLKEDEVMAKGNQVGIICKKPE